MRIKDPVEVVLSLVEQINAHSIEGVCALTSKDHVFTDSVGRVVRGREAMRSAWTRYFASFPDYKTSVAEVLQNGNTVVLLGQASGTYAVDGKLEKKNRWKIPAAWRAVVRAGLVAEWQVYADHSRVIRILEANRR